jgi:hypothetical protein
MKRCAAVAVLVALVLLPGCDDAAQTTDSWGGQAEDVTVALVNAYDVADPYQTARFFSAGGTLSLGTWGGGIATTPEEVVGAVEQAWFMASDLATVKAEHLFVTLDGAIVWWWAFDDGGGQDWAQTYVFGNGGRTTSMTFRQVDLIPPEYTSEGGIAIHFTPEEEAALHLADRYVAAWAARDESMLAEVYAPAVVVRDDIRGDEWRSRDELLSGLADRAPIEPGPWPGVFVFQADGQVQAIVMIQMGGDCPMLEARRLALDGDLVVREVRYTHVQSARRCLTDLPDGWWTTFELAPELQDNVTEILDVGGSLVDLVNAEPNHDAFSRWLFNRYFEAGIGVPEVAAVWFPPAPECNELGGLAIEADERYAGRHTVAICYTDDRLTSDQSASGWHEPALGYGLHELAHIWMVDHLTDETRAAFNEMAGLSVWRGAEAEWANRGVERAAFTMAWGLAGTEDALYPIFFPPETCEELAARYELLTGRQPLTTCGEGGWEP